MVPSGSTRRWWRQERRRPAAAARRARRGASSSNRRSRCRRSSRRRRRRRQRCASRDGGRSGRDCWGAAGAASIKEPRQSGATSVTLHDPQMNESTQTIVLPSSVQNHSVHCVSIIGSAASRSNVQPGEPASPCQSCRLRYRCRRRQVTTAELESSPCHVVLNFEFSASKNQSSRRGRWGAASCCAEPSPAALPGAGASPKPSWASRHGALHAVIGSSRSRPPASPVDLGINGRHAWLPWELL